MLLYLSGCGNGGGVRMIDTGCEWMRPIYVSDHNIAVMSVPTQGTILARNETWEWNCSKTKASKQIVGLHL